MAVVERPALVRRLVLTRAEIALVTEVLGAELPAPLVPAPSVLAEVEPADRDEVIDGLVTRGALITLDAGGSHPVGQTPVVNAAGERAVVVQALARSWALLSGTTTAIDLTVAGTAPVGSDTPAVAQRAWVSLSEPAAASLRRVDDERVELSVFPTTALATELGGLVPEPSWFGATRRASIADALGTGAVARPAGEQDLGRVRGDSPEAAAMMRQERAGLRATVTTRTARGPAVGTLSWVCTETAWWQVDADWRRWQRTGERETVLTRVPAGQAGNVLAAQVQRLLLAGASVSTSAPAPAGDTP